MPYPGKTSPIKRWRSFGLKIAFAAVLTVAVIGFCFCYGRTASFLGWAASVVVVASALFHRLRKFSITLLIVGFAGLLLWPIDASLKFPILRKLHSMVPFGPEITVFPSPSGQCVAYVYNHSFLDSTYGVRFAHGLGFPGDLHWIPLGDLSNTTIETRWDFNTFSVDVNGSGITLIYDERTRKITLPKGDR